MLKIAIDLSQQNGDTRAVLKNAMLLDPTGIVLIGEDKALEREAARKGVTVEVLPAGSPVPQDALKMVHRRRARQ